MYNLILSLLFSLISFGVFAQEKSPTDSLFLRQQVDSLIVLSNDSLDANNYDGAFAFAVDAQKIAIERFGEVSESNANCVNQMALVKQNSGKYEEAEKIFLEALSLKEKTVGKVSVNYCGSLINLGSLYSSMDRFEAAESHFVQAKQIFEDELNDHSNQFYINLLTNLGLLYCYSGRFAQAEPIMVDALELNGDKNGRNSIGFCGDLVNLGMVYGQQGKYEDAEALFLEAKVIFEDSLDNRTHKFYSICVNNLAFLYRIMGLYDQAEQLFIEILPRIEKEFGATHPKYASALMDYAGVSYEKGDLEKAQSILEEVIEIYKKNGDQESQAYSDVVANLANIYRKNGRYEEAETMFLKKLAIDKATYSNDNSFMAVSISNLAHLYAENLGKLQEAEKMYIKASKIFEANLGTEHTDYLLSLSYLAKLYTNQGKYAAAAELYAKSAKGQQKNLLRATRHLGDRELFSFTQKLEHARQLVFSNSMLAAGQAGASVCLDDVLFQKGFLLQESEKVKRLARTTEAGTALYAELSETENTLAQQHSQPFEKRDSTQIASLTTRAAELEKDLARTVAGFGSTQAQTSWRTVQAALKSNEATIEFVHFDFWREEYTDSIMYAALLTMPHLDTPKFIALFEENTLENLLQTTGKRKADYVNKVYTSVDLYAMLWQPLEAYLSGIDKIYFSPSGLLNRLKLGAIPVAEGAVLADRYQLVQLGSTRQLVDSQVFKSSISKKATLFGGIQFDMDETAITSANSDLALRSADGTRGVLDFSVTDSTARSGDWSYLSWTEKEVDVLQSIFSKVGMNSNLFKGFSATEEAFKSVSGAASPRIFHIATHGYFFPDPKTSNATDESAFKSSDHPMIRSGLILAGGNYAWKNGSPAKPNMEDGVLTAYEISQMDLSNTELVVLSACETGLGDIQGNEGVYGLQRAFKIAGVKYLIMSLWQVPDYQTQELMTVFYEKWLNENMDLPDAFRAAQKEMRTKYEHPYFWAGFVLVE